MTAKAAKPGAVTVEGVRVAVAPGAETVAVRDMMPTKPFTTPTLIVDEPVESLGIFRLAGDAVMVKSAGGPAATVS